MAVVTGNNLRIFAGANLDVIGCEDSCTVTVMTEEIITTTRGSGRGTNREYGRYDATLSSTGVIFLYPSEAAATAADRFDPTYFQTYIIAGTKVAAKYQVTDGTTIKETSGIWIVRSSVFTGTSGEAAMFNIELDLDGELTETITTADYITTEDGVIITTEDGEGLIVE